MLERTVLRLLVGVAVPIASAILIEQLPKTGVAEIPFPFQMEEQTLPAGTYLVKQADHERAVCIQNQQVSRVGMKCVEVKGRFGRAQGARLVLKEHEGRYFLSEIWFEADGRGLILPKGGLQESPSSNATGGDVRYVRFE
jgi:hypothetical protein